MRALIVPKPTPVANMVDDRMRMRLVRPVDPSAVKPVTAWAETGSARQFAFQARGPRFEPGTAHRGTAYSAVSARFGDLPRPQTAP